MIAIDQTLDSLAFLSSRSKFENLDNITCVQDDIRKVQLEALADFAVVNGVLEWVPEEGDIEIKKYYGKKLAKDYEAVNPELTQMKFLEGVGKSLKEGGKLLLAIENRLDYTHFLGKPDPHVNLPFTAILPRVLANAVSKICLGRPYVNYLYSFPKIKRMLVKAGFKMVDLYAVFPDYRYPSLILPFKGGIERYAKYWPWRDISWKRRIAYSIEYVLMAILKARILAPSIIAVAKK